MLPELSGASASLRPMARGRFGLVQDTCGGSKAFPGIADSAYGGGELVLSQLAAKGAPSRQMIHIVTIMIIMGISTENKNKYDYTLCL